jgi:hypothetical protein
VEYVIESTDELITMIDDPAYILLAIVVSALQILLLIISINNLEFQESTLSTLEKILASIFISITLSCNILKDLSSHFIDSLIFNENNIIKRIFKAIIREISYIMFRPSKLILDLAIGIKICLMVNLVVGIITMQTQLYDCLVRFLGGLVILELDNYIGSVIKKKVTITRHRIVGVEYEEQRKTIFLFMAITILVVVLVNLFLRKENENLLK